jgi:molybdopterin converting factor small subunit
MPVVKLRAPLRDRAGGGADHDLPGGTVGEVLRALEERHPTVKGWILDEHGRIRSHVNVYVNGERSSADTPVASGDGLLVLPSISGGARGDG